MKIVCKLSPQEYRSVYEKAYSQETNSRLYGVFSVISLFLIFVVWATIIAYLSGYLISSFVFAMLIVVILFSYFIHKERELSRCKRITELLIDTHMQIVVDENGIFAEYCGVTVNIPWKCVGTYADRNEYIGIQGISAHTIHIPKSKLAPQEVQEILKYAEQMRHVMKGNMLNP